MAIATDTQVQRYVDERCRPRAEQLVRSLNAMADDAAAIPDIWQRAAQGDPWTDARVDGPPRLAASADILAYNAFVQVLVKVFEGTATNEDVATIPANWAAVRTLAVNAPQV